MRYKLDAEGESWSENVPTAANVGTYTVSYDIVGNANYRDVGPFSVTAKILSGGGESGSTVQPKPVEMTDQEKEDAKESISSQGIDTSNLSVKSITEENIGNMRDPSELNDTQKLAVSDDTKVPAAILRR